VTPQELDHFLATVLACRRESGIGDRRTTSIAAMPLAYQRQKSP